MPVRADDRSSRRPRFPRAGPPLPRGSRPVRRYPIRIAVLSAVLTTLAVGGPCGRAAAQPVERNQNQDASQRTEQAGQHFAAGDRYLDQGDFARALEEYKRAYELA